MKIKISDKTPKKALQEYGYLGNFRFRTFLPLRIHIADQYTAIFIMTAIRMPKQEEKFCLELAFILLDILQRKHKIKLKNKEEKRK